VLEASFSAALLRSIKYLRKYFEMSLLEGDEKQ
jgi:hypothetical protein